MFVPPKYEGNALAVTDEEVVADWRLGAVRNLARTVRMSGLPLDSTDRWGRTEPGTNREHVEGSDTSKPCRLVEVYDLEVEGTREWYPGPEGGSDYDMVEVTSRATCSCGRLTKYPVATLLSPSDFFEALLAAEEE